jgi:hypothetical protein
MVSWLSEDYCNQFCGSNWKQDLRGTVYFLSQNFDRLIAGNQFETDGWIALYELATIVARKEVVGYDRIIFSLIACVSTYNLLCRSKEYNFFREYNIAVENLVVELGPLVFRRSIHISDKIPIIRIVGNLSGVEDLIPLRRYKNKFKVKRPDLVWHERDGVGSAMVMVLQDFTTNFPGKHWKLALKSKFLISPKLIRFKTAYFEYDAVNGEFIVGFEESSKNPALAADWTTGMLFHWIMLQKHSRTSSIPALSGLLRFEKFINQEGLYFITPFRNDRVPLILVHGFFSTSHTWIPLVNALLPPDNRIFDYYQIAVFQYPTGQSLLFTLSMLEQAINGVVTLFGDPIHRLLRETVLIGHSMVCRVLLSHS